MTGENERTIKMERAKFIETVIIGASSNIPSLCLIVSFTVSPSEIMQFAVQDALISHTTGNGE